MALLLALVALPAQADLYRWIDPETGTVKLSNLPPSAAGVQVQVVPGGPAVAPSGAAARPDTSLVASLEARWRAALAELVTLPERADFDPSGEELRQHMIAYETARAELDRADPGGAARRKAETAPLLQRFGKALAR